MTAVKDEAARLVAALPDDATWDDLMYEIHVRQAIEAGIADSEAGSRLRCTEALPSSTRTASILV